MNFSISVMLIWFDSVCSDLIRLDNIIWNSEEISKISSREHIHHQKRVLFLFNFEQDQIANFLNYCNYPAQKGKIGKSELFFLQINVFTENVLCVCTDDA